MKKTIFSFLLMVLATAQVVLAADNVRISSWAKEAFEKQFPTAKYAKWYELNEAELYVVTFGYESESMVAYVDRTGIVLATVRNVDINHVPFPVKESITRKYGSYSVTKIEELSMNSEVTYLVHLENGKRQIGLRIYPGGNFYEIKSEKIK